MLCWFRIQDHPLPYHSALSKYVINNVVTLNISCEQTSDCQSSACSINDDASNTSFSCDEICKDVVINVSNTDNSFGMHSAWLHNFLDTKRVLDVFLLSKATHSTHKHRNIQQKATAIKLCYHLKCSFK